jgi:hypothetical protein
MFKCDHPGCKYTHDSKQGIAAHKSAHLPPEIQAERVAKRLATMKNNGTKKPAVLNADDIFERVEKATRILFPDPEVLYERFEEIAELRRIMLQALKR